MNKLQVILFVLIVTASFLMTANKAQYKISEWDSQFRQAGAPYESRGRLQRESHQAWHIKAEDESSAVFYIAYAACENNFRGLQTLLARSKALSGKAINTAERFDDFLLHWIGLREAAKRGVEELTKTERDLVQAYAHAINYYAITHSDQVLHGSIYPITEEDIVGYFYYYIQDTVRLKALASLLWSGTQAIPVIPRQEESISHEQYQKIINSYVQDKITDLKKEPAAPKGSTAYAMGPGRAAERQTFLAINPHQKWAGEDSESSYFYVSVETETGWKFAGMVLPGMPLPLMGHNSHLGWAHTMNHPDLIDLFVLRLNPTNADEYWYNDEWRTLERSTIDLPTWVANMIPWTLKKEVLSSVYGPTVRIDEQHAMALGFSGFDPALAHFVGQYLSMSQATNWKEWQEAHRQGALPLMSTVYADHEGNLFYHYGARVAKRNDHYVWRFAVPGESAETQWGEYLSYDELPQVFNPSSDFLYDCNASPFHVALNSSDNPVPTAFTPDLELNTQQNNRALRLHELMSDIGNEVSWEAFCELKYDWTYSPQSLVAQYTKRLIAECDRALRIDRPWAKGLSPELIKEAQGHLEQWNYQADANNTRAALAILTLSPFLQADLWSPDPAPWVDGHFEMVLERFHSVISRLHGSFRRLDVSWGRIHRLIREGVYDIPMAGGPDLLYNHRGQPYNDALRITSGDNLFLFVSWNSEGRLTRSQVGDIYYEAANARQNHTDPARQLRTSALMQSPPVPTTSPVEQTTLKMEESPHAHSF